MAPPSPLAPAVQAAVVASAHLAAYERVADAALACGRLGALSSGRWRAVARELERLRDDLEHALDQVDQEIARRAAELGVDEEALWTAGDAAGTFDLLREEALATLAPGDDAARLLRGDVLFGVAFLEDAENADRGTTLLFGWPEPLTPAAWPWEATWIAQDGQPEAAEQEELDLFEVGEPEVGGPLLSAVAAQLGVDPDAAAAALRGVAAALTRASLLADADEDEAPDGARDR